MTKILIPIDGSAASVRALEQLLQRGTAGLELHLLNVQLPVDGNVRSFVSSDELNAYHRNEGLAELATARALLDAAGASYQQHVLVGPPGRPGSPRWQQAGLRRDRHGQPWPHRPAAAADGLGGGRGVGKGQDQAHAGQVI